MKERPAALPGPQKQGRKTVLQAWIKNEVFRVGLAETLCTYVMMVRENNFKS